ncbi:MAG: hypothetical protein KDC54_12850 [Lewinella sp.]|nr:hypothetical protein [Lewinella sp.]
MDQPPPSSSNHKLKAWLDNLQQESWQLELLISGFVIFLLIGAYEPLMEWRQQIFRLGLSSETFMALLIPQVIVMGAWLSLLINLMLHVLLRGLWISTIGLRYVSEDIDYEALQLHPRFEQFLRRRIGSFDLYIERLEKLCSVLFAFTFLVIFIIFSLGLFLAGMAIVNWLLEELLHWEGTLPNKIFELCIVLIGLIYFIDFLTLARLKRKRWAARWYYPLYRFMSVVTLARLYRPLYYNLIDNPYGRRLGYGLVPYVLALMVLPSITYIRDGYFPTVNDDTHLVADHYDDSPKDEQALVEPSIPSRYISNGFLEVFIPYLARMHDPAIEANHPELEPAKFTGFKLRGTVNIGKANNAAADRDSLLTAMGEIHQLYLNDSLIVSPEWQFYVHPTRDMPGLLTIIDLGDAPRGRHDLRVETYSYSNINVLFNDSLSWHTVATIPFWLDR